ncbi:MAG: hypothetical protein UU22_C0017G0016 [Parcubacteria group bacterium GW2011_GWA2_40_8]|nr:MAG: hypothetical protein UU22_C0017G0016 [Parcubacteria group bacterium GW2011_GWA2_40_8]
MPVVLFLAGFFAAINILAAEPPSDDLNLPIYAISVVEQGIAYSAEAESGATIGQILEKNGFKTSNSDIISHSSEEAVVPGDTIYIYHATPVTIVDGGVGSETFTLANTVASLINEKGIILNEIDILTPSENTNIKTGLVVKIRRRVIEKITEVLEVPFKKISSEDPETSYGKVTITKPGILGKKEVEFEVLKEDGKTIKKKQLKETILEQSEAQEESIGSRILIGKTDEALGSWYHAFPGMYAASTTYPRKSFVRVTNLNNNKSVIVKINDYGPTIPGRIIDLEATAFKKLSPLSRGVIPVRVEQIL